MTEQGNGMRNYVSHEYKAKCIEWALRFNERNVGDSKPDDIVDAATKFYAYVYGDGK